jgi:AcrR family transcriptional regulator
VQRRAHILHATLGLVARVGADRVRLRDVADEANVSIGMLQHYFSTRDALLREAFHTHAAEVTDRVQTAGALDVDPWQRITSLITSITRPADFHQRCVLWVEFAAAASRDAELRTLMSEAYDRWRTPLTEAVQAGVSAQLFRPLLSAESVVNTLLALIDGYELAVAIGEQPDISRVGSELTAVAQALLDHRSPAGG